MRTSPSASTVVSRTMTRSSSSIRGPTPPASADCSTIRPGMTTRSSTPWTRTTSAACPQCALTTGRQHATWTPRRAIFAARSTSSLWMSTVPKHSEPTTCGTSSPTAHRRGHRAPSMNSETPSSSTAGLQECTAGEVVASESSVSRTTASGERYSTTAPTTSKVLTCTTSPPRCTALISSRRGRASAPKAPPTRQPPAKMVSSPSHRSTSTSLWTFRTPPTTPPSAVPGSGISTVMARRTPSWMQRSPPSFK
mmetsp:Transcript_22337/g.62306  ORF Transcript_22337/g.62306 Transcript_22337/m.62306 type:complete len:252 (-) Transcript_22337:569-1324(-)